MGYLTGVLYRFGRFSLQECFDRLNRAKVDTPAPCHSGADSENLSYPPHFDLVQTLSANPLRSPS